MYLIYVGVIYCLDHMIKASDHKVDHWTNLDGGRKSENVLVLFAFEGKEYKGNQRK